ncbi:unnamed protein product [Plutella xylostella]|uniref:(diamondback moth) hypothetical protein n=1 Tax=Plutella xylostella TaxID=51655 RepID=A0A8S4EB12_PLUXY|nr:unnamed protein product [Plutella xylostella]
MDDKEVSSENPLDSSKEESNPLDSSKHESGDAPDPDTVSDAVKTVEESDVADSSDPASSEDAKVDESSEKLIEESSDKLVDDSDKPEDSEDNLLNHVDEKTDTVDGKEDEETKEPEEVDEDALLNKEDDSKEEEESEKKDDAELEASSEKDSQKDENSQSAETESQDADTSKPSQDLDISQDADTSKPSQDLDISQDGSVDEKQDKDKNPEFETAPASTEESQEDHTEALDPFDALLKDTPVAETSTASASVSVSASVNLDDDDDDHNADGDAPPVADDDDDNEQPAEDATLDDSVAELPEEPGADEEVCLLPDTEREISDADKAEAEKVLAEKRKLAEEAAEAEAAVPKVEEKDADETTAAEETEPPAALAEDASQENGEKETENELDDNAEDECSENLIPNTIQEISSCEGTCLQCDKEQSCTYRFRKDGEEKYLCSELCVKEFQESHVGQYTVTHKKYLIEEIVPREMTCSECEETKLCYFYYNYDGEDTNYCSINCLHSMMADEQDKYVFKRRRLTIREMEPKEVECYICKETKKCSYLFERYGEVHYICEVACIKKETNNDEFARYMIKKMRPVRKPVAPVNPPLLKLKVISNATDKYLDEAYKIQAKTPAMIAAAREERERTFVRVCFQCNLMIKGDDKNLTWETMDFCNEGCLGRYQNAIGSKCANCKNGVTHTSLGKYCVRFGYDIRQFCNSSCLEEFKKGLKICCYCQRDISSGHQGFLAPVGDKGQFKDFCSQVCMEKFDQMSKNPVPQPVWAKCAVCSLDKATNIEVEVNDNVNQRLCSDPCFAAFKFVNNVFPDQCRWCKKYFERRSNKCFTIYDGASPHCFCSKSCLNVYISNTRHIVPCNWCKVKKYNFDMIKRNQSNVMMCSLNCLNLYQVSVNAVSSRRIKCDMCKRTSLAQYHLTMSDATVRNFCTYQCVMSFQGQYSKHGPPLQPGENVEQPKAVPTGAPRRTYAAAAHKNNAAPVKVQQRTGLPVISNVQSLAAPPPLTLAPRGKSKRLQQIQIPVQPEPEPPQAPKTPPPPPKPPTPPPPPPPKIYNHVLVKTLPPSQVANKATMTKPMMVSKGVSCRPHPCTKECQTDPSLERRVLIPVPVPIYVPVPCAMWSIPFPVPVPIPIPIPTPVFIPTTRNSAKGIMKEINKIHDKMPTDPFEAELLMMAEMVAGDKKKDQSDSDTDDDNEAGGGFSPVGGMDGNNAFGEDMLQMALKMATEYEEQPVDLESAMTANTITPSSHPGMPVNAFGEDMLQMALKMATEYEEQPVDLESAMTANTITPSSHPGMPG